MLNGGIVIVARDYEVDEKTKTLSLTRPSIINGAQTQGVLRDHAASLKKFAIGDTDDPSHEYRRWRIARYLTWRNKEKGSSKAALAQFSRVKLYWH